MTALTFTLKAELKQRVDASPLTPDRLTGKSPSEVGAELLQCGNRQIRTDELFSIEGQNSDSLVFRGATGKLDYIGKGMSRGEIHIEGDAGSYLGMHLKGGRVVVSGNVDAYAACEMKNGEILIRGNTGDFLGACLPGNKKGMAGGVVIVKGNAGDRVGDHLRRGAILIEGDAGCYLGARMTAGTIAVLGKVGDHLGYGMGRGTVLLAQVPTSIPPTFNDCGTHTLGFIPLLLKGFQGLETRFSDMSGPLRRVRRYAGDMCGLGKGEILIAV
ncbi:formylmethanofuran dehydrogenase subunit C [Methylocaldum sp.]|uniref:formylmethanofuran dehydrogenase subunit C n=1 Tax=Methylocaldum sp. TaxID=1969727 RepID=UPI002D40FD0D|nr:formylmethanofuran dehydrogenase subunit C [Methylocaldum sp.]HYE35983.1 formylmethanofuran dehydrogenase subunit C [Methylocaldum sp.]